MVDLRLRYILYQKIIIFMCAKVDKHSFVVLYLFWGGAMPPPTNILITLIGRREYKVH